MFVSYFIIVFLYFVNSSLRGHVNTNRYASGGTSYSFSRHIIHGSYNSNTYKNDIGLLMTSSNVALSNSVSLVALNFDFIGAGVGTSVTGWGRIRVGKNIILNFTQT